VLRVRSDGRYSPSPREPCPRIKRTRPPPPPPAIKVAVSKVTNVTVYSNSALVTREVEVVGNAGRVELVVSPLAPTTVPSSLYAEGAEGIRVLTTRFRTRPIVEDNREDVRKLIDEIHDLQLAKEKIERRPPGEPGEREDSDQDGVVSLASPRFRPPKRGC